MEEVVLGQKEARDWKYRGEGAANLVLSYTGDSSFFVGKVLRIRKSPRCGTPGYVSENSESAAHLTKHECLVWRDTEDLVSAPTQELVEQQYVKHVIGPLLGPEHVDVGIQVPVSKDFLESVEENICCQRPMWRVQAAKVNTLCSSALLLSDHSVFPHPHGNIKGELCITVEIKPKCGFLPLSKFISEQNAVKKSITRFRMHQLLKLHKKETSEISEYDPLDMFSGSKDRIHKSIKSLFNTPQNNFRVFMNGILVFGGLGGGAESTNCVIGEDFEDVLRGMIQADDDLRVTSFLNLVTEVLFSSGLLNQLLKVQKLDIFDIEGAIHAYYDVISQPCVVCRDLGENTLSGKYKDLHLMGFDESLNVVKDYLIAATAKDLSMMISFRPRDTVDEESPYKGVFLDSSNQTFDYKASFIDLDLKPLKRMEHYYALDQKIVRHYSQIMEIEPLVEQYVGFKSNGTSN